MSDAQSVGLTEDAAPSLAYYNEFEPFAAEWLGNLIDQGHITNGAIDARSIRDVSAGDVAGFERVHFFAGLGGWERALELAGWPKGVCVWTGSCPCQPFSVAGKGKGVDDERHLWPEMFRLIRECVPKFIFGEQVDASGVISGVDCSDEELQSMQDKEAVFSVLRELQGACGENLRRLPREGEGKETKESCPDIGITQAMEKCQAWPCSCECGEIPSEREGAGIQPRCESDPGDHRHRTLPSDWNSVRSVDAQGVECSVARQGGFNKGLHSGEHEGSSLCPKCGGQYVGRESFFGDCVGDHSEAQSAIKQLVREAFQGHRIEDRPRWFDGVRNDLEAIGYEVWSCSLPAASVGAPHIRQRLFWVAYTGCVELHTGAGLRQGLDQAERSKSGEHVNASADIFAGLEYPEGERRGEGRAESIGRSTEPRRGASGLGDSASERFREAGKPEVDSGASIVPSSSSSGMDYAERSGLQERNGVNGVNGVKVTRSPWKKFELASRSDGKVCRVSAQPGNAPLAYGIPRELGRGEPTLRRLVGRARRNRVGRIKAYGNAIVPEVAAIFISAAMETLGV